MEALGQFVERLTEPTAGGARASVTGRRIGVVATAGDRRDEDIRELGRVAAGYFDDIIVREDANNRGRPRGATAALITEGIDSAGPSRRVGEVRTVLDELEATRAALDMARDGDVVVVCVDHANQVWKELQRRQHGGSSESSDGLRAVVGVLDADDEVDLDL
jgi:cyanophycin synthetase